MSSSPGAQLRVLHAEIRACERCVVAGYIERAQPIVAGRADDRIMVIGQAPGMVELTTNAPFSGRSGATLRAWLAEAGIREDELPYRTSITKCFPGKAASGAGDRKPSPAEIALCVPFLSRELELVRPQVVMLLGQLAIERFWGKAPLQDTVGSSRRAGERAYIPLPHPSGASRWLNGPKNRRLLRKGLSLLAREVRALRRAGHLRQRERRQPPAGRVEAAD